VSKKKKSLRRERSYDSALLRKMRREGTAERDYTFCGGKGLACDTLQGRKRRAFSRSSWGSSDEVSQLHKGRSHAGVVEKNPSMPALGKKKKLGPPPLKKGGSQGGPEKSP